MAQRTRVKKADLEALTPKLAELVKSGLPVTEAAEKVGLKYATAVRVLKKAGVPVKRGRKPSKPTGAAGTTTAATRTPRAKKATAAGSFVYSYKGKTVGTFATQAEADAFIAGFKAAGGTGLHIQTTKQVA